MSAFANLTGLTAQLIRHLRDADVRRRVADTHRATAALGAGRLAGYLGVSRDLLRAMAVDGMTHADECLLLMTLASRVRAGVIVEIGSYRGRSTIALAAGAARGWAPQVYAVEPHGDFIGVLGGRFGPADRTAFEANVARSPHGHLIHLVSATSQVAARVWSREIGLLWIDGDHRYDAVRRDFELWSPFLGSDAHVAFDDSTVPGIGPHAVVEEILATGRYVRREVVGKITVLAPAYAVSTAAAAGRAR